MIQLGTVGRISSGDDSGKFVKIQKLPDDPPSFLILIAHDREFRHGYGDYWVEDYGSLQEFFREGQWVVQWLEPEEELGGGRS
ncbi:hypothetical protein AQ490_24375 [Wenjunlia vitaminophila]|uniref:Uncharacterized protein n=1 Tax=Wenjunlia vitaminophila TaxID=76728 RepID=A0A0T6LRJ8_WENVI|nr:hypothetical protein AQ490_24375 [Wenjunlia vitaminophila]